MFYELNLRISHRYHNSNWTNMKESPRSIAIGPMLKSVLYTVYKRIEERITSRGPFQFSLFPLSTIISQMRVHIFLSLEQGNTDVILEKNRAEAATAN